MHELSIPAALLACALTPFAQTPTTAELDHVSCGAEASPETIERWLGELAEADPGPRILRVEFRGRLERRACRIRARGALERASQQLERLVAARLEPGGLLRVADRALRVAGVERREVYDDDVGQNIRWAEPGEL